MLKHSKTLVNVINYLFTDEAKLAELKGIKEGGKILTTFKEEMERQH